jgi:hypothetical protein
MTNPAQSAPSLGLATLRIAQAELARGVREVPLGSNTSVDVRRYLAPCVRHGRRVYPHPETAADAWCAAFASWCVWQAWWERTNEGYPFPSDRDEMIADGARTWGDRCPCCPPIGYRAAVSELVDDARATGALRLPNADEYPLPGDLIVYGRDNQSPLHGGHGHVAVCERWSPVDGHAVISGNSHDRVARDEWDAGDSSPWGPMLAWIKL